jgi:hypothetical protein
MKSLYGLGESTRDNINIFNNLSLQNTFSFGSKQNIFLHTFILKHLVLGDKFFVFKMPFSNAPLLSRESWTLFYIFWYIYYTHEVLCSLKHLQNVILSLRMNKITFFFHGNFFIYTYLLLFIPISIYYERFRRIIIFLILLLLNNNNMGCDECL